MSGLSGTPASPPAAPTTVRPARAIYHAYYYGLSSGISTATGSRPSIITRFEEIDLMTAVASTPAREPTSQFAIAPYELQSFPDAARRAANSGFIPRCPIAHRGCAGPESILPIVVMDSGLAQERAPE